MIPDDVQREFDRLDRKLESQSQVFLMVIGELRQAVGELRTLVQEQAETRTTERRYDLEDRRRARAANLIVVVAVLVFAVVATAWVVRMWG